MELTAQELKHIERIRKHQRTWRWSRWITLLVAVGFLVLAGWMLWFAWSASSRNPPDVTLFCIGFTKAHFYIACGIFALWVTTRQWNGNMDHALLLKLIDQCGAQATTPSEPPTKPPQPTSVTR